MKLTIRIPPRIQPIQLIFLRSNSTKPPTTVHTIPRGEKSYPDADQTATRVPAPLPPVDDQVPVPADIVSGAPEDLRRRTVRIYRPTKSAMQSGLHGNLYWRLDWDVEPKDNRWEHPVMNWAGRHYVPEKAANDSGDYMQATRMAFPAKEDAIQFAEKQGWEYYVQEPHSRQFKPKAYATNFNYSASKLKVLITK